MTNQQTYTINNNDDDDDDDFFHKKYIQKQKSINPDLEVKISDSQDNTQIEEDIKLGHKPRRERKAHQYLNDHRKYSEEVSDPALIIVIKPLVTNQYLIKKH